MGLKEIREKNKKNTSLLHSKIEYNLDKESIDEIKKFFKDCVEPMNVRTLKDYLEITENQ